jgi:hypothetical protein
MGLGGEQTLPDRNGNFVKILIYAGKLQTEVAGL